VSDLGAPPSERRSAARASRPAESERGAEERQRLEAERDVLLKSLDDLEDERAAGAIDDASYEQLHDDYTARAAAVIRALRDGIDARPTQPPSSTARRLAVICGVAAFAIIAGVALAAALGARLPGQTTSGNSGPASTASTSATADRRAELEAAVAKDPSDAGSRILLARLVEADNDLAEALRLYDQVIAIDPKSAEAYAQSGRILYLTAGSAPADAAAGLVDTARSRLDTAVSLDPEYVDARFFRAIVLANEYQDFSAAQNDLQRYLVRAPNGLFADQARQLLADVTNALEAPTTTVPKSGN
jgi:cytochrome c-type biogenesis protein CcmH/NrfG